MVASAITFLSDPKVQSSSMSQRVSFSSPRVCVTRNRRGHPSSQPNRKQAARVCLVRCWPTCALLRRCTYGAYPGGPAQQQQGRDWRDWFIKAVVSGTIGYGVISLAKKYLMPHLQPPNANVLEADLDSLLPSTTR